MKADVVTRQYKYMDGTDYQYCETVHEVMMESGDVLFTSKNLKKIKNEFNVTSYEKEQIKINIS